MKTEISTPINSLNSIALGITYGEPTVVMLPASSISFASTAISPLDKRVVVRGNVSSVSVPYNVLKEGERRENLIANRGLTASKPTTTE